MIIKTSDGTLRLAANLKFMFTEVPMLDRFSAAASAGFAAVELPQPYAFDPLRLRQRLDAVGLRTVLINTPAGPAGSGTVMGAAFDPEARKEFRDGIDRGLEYATELGSPNLHVMAGLRPAGCDPDGAFACYVANIAWAADRARGRDIRLVLEAINKRDQPAYGLASAEVAAHVAEAVGADVVGVLFDVYHAQVDRGDLLTRYDSLHHLIRHIQIADNPGRAEPGTGEIGYPAVLRQIARSGYEGWIGCEYRPSIDTATSLRWITKIIEERS
ncbi:hydroxypyruvate isomerase family protein [Microlunatus sp. GCM10028923]|uniref:hydroxypyruvate isomerase family protein n=1 Tax=Microlunatus sp. GCM10028923 TaxID=3273400 RepID=UPI00361FC3C8